MQMARSVPIRRGPRHHIEASIVTSLSAAVGRRELVHGQIPGTVRLLVVEDAPKMSSLLRRAFVQGGYAVDVAAPGHEAVWKASEVAFGAVVLAGRPPDSTGIPRFQAS